MTCSCTSSHAHGSHMVNQDGYVMYLKQTWDKCMQNLKHNEDLSGIRRFKCPKLLFVGPKGFKHATIKGDAFFLKVLPSLDVEHIHMKFFPSTKNSRMCLRKIIQMPCPSINRMTITIDLEKGTQLPFEPIYNIS